MTYSQPQGSPRELVKGLLYYLVERGDTLEYLARSLGGWHCTEYHVQCGGYLWWDDDWKYYPERQPKKNLNRWQIGVTRFRSEPCLYIFSLPELVTEIAYEIRHGHVSQLELFG
jgi:hypothetical protein